MTARLIGLLVAAIMLAAIVFGGPALIRTIFSQKAEIRVIKGQADAGVDAGAAAMNTVSNVIAADDAADQIHEEGLNAIRTAPEGGRGAATVDASCRLRLYRDSERCARLRSSRPEEPAAAD